MDYSIRIASCQGAVAAAPTTLRVGSAGCTIGRNPDNDLPLADPERVVSGRHARLEVRDGVLWITDLSTNGTFLNGASDRLPTHQAVRLAAGDCLTVGPYELVVSTAESGALDLPGLPGGPGPDIMDLLGEGALGETRPHDPFADAVALDPLLSGPAAPAAAALVTPPLTPFEHVHVRAPELAPAARPAEPRGAPAAAVPDDYDLLADSGLRGADRFGSIGVPESAPVPEPPLSWADPFAAAPPLPAATPAERPARAEPPPAAVPDPGDAREPIPALAPAVGAETPVPGTEAAAPLPRPGGRAGAAPPVASAGPAKPPESGGADATLAAFLAGLGVADQARVGDPERLLHDAGRLLRTLIEGLVATMRVRAEFKSQMGLGVTILRAAENNPFKFSVDADEAMERLLVRPGGGYLPAVDAARGAFEDIQAHEMAMLDSLRAAMRALLARFEPGVLEERLGAAKGLDKLLPMARRSRYWDVFTEIYEDVARDAADGFMELFSEAFTRAYEDQIRRLAQARRTAAGGSVR